MHGCVQYQRGQKDGNSHVRITLREGQDARTVVVCGTLDNGATIA
jgi:hypothetical protein